MTYDEHREQVLMFGGMNAHDTLGDLWAWDGRAWSRLSASGPAPRGFAVFAYDANRRRAILFGGRATSEESPAGTFTDTWEWDGVRWIEKPVPGPNMPHPIGACDKRRARLVVYGGITRAGETTGPWVTDTWEWDGERWSRRSNVAVEGTPNQILYDGRRKQVVMVMGDGAAWCWDGLQWQRITDERGPDRQPALEGMPPRSGYAIAYDTRRKRVVLFGGTGGFGEGRVGGLFGDTWEWTGTAWVRVDGR
jgi:hypothetical protein